MSHSVCYVDRCADGAALRGLRLVTRRTARTWTSGGPPRSAQAALDAAGAAARWIIENAGESAGGGSRPVVICLDLDASVCSWITAPSSELRVVRAAAQAVAVGAGSEDGAGGPSATWLSLAELGTDESVQPLSEPAVRGAGGAGTPEHPHRMGVLAVADLAARTLLDALDAARKPPARVISLWHAMAEAWGRVEPGEAPGREAVGETEPSSAVVLIEPEGRLAWCWSRGGCVLAAGTMQLKRTVPAAEAEAGGEGAAGALEISRADLGRLISDWLAWGTQTGMAPGRIVCLAPPNLTMVGLDGDLPEQSGAAVVGQTLGHAWPGSVVAAEVMADPVGATLQRLVDLSDDVPAAGELEELSSRPGRGTKRLYHWMALATLGGAAVIGVLGARLMGGASSADEATAKVREQRAAVLERVKSLAPRAATEADPIAIIRAERLKIEGALKAVQPENPVFRELARLVKTVSEVGGVTITDVRMNAGRQCVVQFDAPDSESWSKVVTAVQSSTAPAPRIDWTQEVRGGSGGKSVYVLRGTWSAAPGTGGPR